jgi:Xaa-Pro aminopeptidase
MKRRDLLKSSLLGGALATLPSNEVGAGNKTSNHLDSHLIAAEIVKKGPLINLNRAYKVMHQEQLDGLIVTLPKNIFYFTGYHDHLAVRYASPTSFALLSKDENKKMCIVMNQFIYYFSFIDGGFKLNSKDFLFTGWNKNNTGLEGGKNNGELQEPIPSAPYTWRDIGEHPIGEIEENRLNILTKKLNEVPESADYDWALKKAIQYLELEKALVGIDHPVIDQTIKKLDLNTKTIDGDHALRRIQIIKSEREIELMKISAQNNADASIAAIRQIRNGATHQDLKSLFFSECSKRGNIPSLLQIDTVNSEVFNKELKNGDSFAIDAVSHGFHYNGDFGRTVFLGEPSRSMKKATDAISIGWDAVREQLKPGLRYSEIRTIGREAMKKSGYNFSVAVTPHSIGLSHTDEPGKNGPGSFWQKDDLILQENMIISVDLPVLNTGIGGTAHLEDLTLITNDGGEQINDIGNRIIVL